MKTQQHLQQLSGLRFETGWKRTSAYLPLKPTLSRPRRSWWQRWKKMLWRLMR